MLEVDQIIDSDLKSEKEIKNSKNGKKRQDTNRVVEMDDIFNFRENQEENSEIFCINIYKL